MNHEQTPETVALELPENFADAPRLTRQTATEPVFDWQIVPPTLKDEDPAGFQKIRLAATLDLLKFEVADLPHQNQGHQRMKLRNVVNFVDNTKNFLASGMPPNMKQLYDHWTDNLGAQAWNVLDSFFKAHDQRVFLHMVNLFSNGMMTLPGMDKPLCQTSFAEVVAAEDEEERLYWKHQQRLGLFVPLTADDLKAGAGATPTEELTLDDFKLANQQIDKAVLVVYEDADGTRNVLKDLTKEVSPEPENITELEPAL